MVINETTEYKAWQKFEKSSLETEDLCLLAMVRFQFWLFKTYENTWILIFTITVGISWFFETQILREIKSSFLD